MNFVCNPSSLFCIRTCMHHMFSHINLHYSISNNLTFLTWVIIVFLILWTLEGETVPGTYSTYGKRFIIEFVLNIFFLFFCPFQKEYFDRPVTTIRRLYGVSWIQIIFNLQTCILHSLLITFYFFNTFTENNSIIKSFG